MKFKLLILILFILTSTTLFSKINNQNIIHKNTEYSVLIFYSTTCPICQYYTKVINELTIQYPTIKFNLVFAGNYSKKTIRKFKLDYNVTQNITVDKRNKFSKKYNATVTPEVFLIKNNEVLYEGLIDDNFYDIGRRKLTGINYYLNDAIKSLMNNEQIKINKTQPIGCLITK